LSINAMYQLSKPMSEMAQNFSDFVLKNSDNVRKINTVGAPNMCQ